MKRIDETIWCNKCNEVTLHKAQYFGARRYTGKYECECVICKSTRDMDACPSMRDIMGSLYTSDLEARQKMVKSAKWMGLNEYRKYRKIPLGRDDNALLEDGDESKTIED